MPVLQCVAVCGSLSQFVAVVGSRWQCVAARGGAFSVCGSGWLYVVSVWKCVAVGFQFVEVWQLVEVC